MRKWDVEPVQLAAMVVGQFPYEAEKIAQDFLQGAAKANNPGTIMFWTVVLNQVEQMQSKLASDPAYAPELPFIGAI